MFNIANIKNELMGLVGIRQPYNSEYAIFDADNLTSKSGLYLDDMPYFKASYLIDCALETGLTNEQVNNSLREIFSSATINVLNRVFNKTDFKESRVLYPFTQNKINLETIANGFIGYELKTDCKESNEININSIKLEGVSTTDQTITIYLFQSGLKQPYKTTTIDLLIGDNTVEKTLDWTLENKEENTYYLGYILDGTFQSYKRDYKDSNVVNAFSELEINRLYVEGHSTPELFNLELIDRISENNGINANISIVDDYTNFIINNKILFARAIQLLSCIHIYHLFIASNNSNIQERYSKDLINRITYLIKGTSGDGLKEQGLEVMASEEIKTITTEINKLKVETGNGYGISIGTFS